MFTILASLFLMTAGGSVDAAWKEALERATREQKPVVVFFRPAECPRCDVFERESLPHPTITRRLESVVFVTLPLQSDLARRAWNGDSPGVAILDRSGTVQARWRVLLDTMQFGQVLDSAIVAAPSLEQVARFRESGDAARSDLALADALMLMRRLPEARVALERVIASEERGVVREALVASAVLDLIARGRDHALRALEAIVAESVADDAGKKAEALIALLENPSRSGTIRILPLLRQVVTGRQVVRTHVTSAATGRVEFHLDGKRVEDVRRPPFAATLDFGSEARRRVLRVVAFDRRGNELARDERVINDDQESFLVRLREPREGAGSGRIRVAAELRVPPGRRVERVTISWNDETHAVLRSAPYTTAIDVAAGEIGVLQCVAELDDGSTSEDAVLLNATAERANVHLVELPVTLLRRDGSPAPADAATLRVLDGGKTRAVEAVSRPADTPLTVGLLLDTSGSMQRALPDLQEAASGFLDSLGPNDRAFLIRFGSYAALAEPATTSRERLKRRIAALQPEGSTALHDAAALGLLQFEGLKGRRAIILFTDGLDRASEYTAEEVTELARRTHVPVHVIASVPVPKAAGPVSNVDAVLRSIVDSTGGTLHVLTDLAQLPAVYRDIHASLRAQVVLAIRTDGATRETEWRPIRVEMTDPDVRVFAPAGYYALWQ